MRLPALLYLNNCCYICQETGLKTLFPIVLLVPHDLDQKKENYITKDLEITIGIPGKEFDDIGF